MDVQEVYMDEGDKEMLKEFMEGEGCSSGRDAPPAIVVEPGATDIDAAVPAEQYEVLVKKLQTDEELIRQLKHIVKAQHGKIEEFREMLEATSVAKNPLISAYEADDLKKALEKNQELQLTIGHLKDGESYAVHGVDFLGS
eukprot:Skav232601  [mRNA]  locus=scaffold3249:20191:24765:- [translate_table: standard]